MKITFSKKVSIILIEYIENIVFRNSRCKCKAFALDIDKYGRMSWQKKCIASLHAVQWLSIQTREREKNM